MKTAVTISIDNEIMAKTRLRTDNISGTIQELLKEWIKNAPEIQEMNEIKKIKLQLQQKEAEMANMMKKINDYEEEKAKRKTVMVLQ